MKLAWWRQKIRLCGRRLCSITWPTRMSLCTFVRKALWAARFTSQAATLSMLGHTLCIPWRLACRLGGRPRGRASVTRMGARLTADRQRGLQKRKTTGVTQPPARLTRLPQLWASLRRGRAAATGQRRRSMQSKAQERDCPVGCPASRRRSRRLAKNRAVLTLDEETAESS